ncbi:MAG: penicillin-binding protein activator LpoB [Spirochaetes bacterium]|nr:penicillin-binding protein activator LpoB [Spirochaetota bacterium]
MRKIAAFVSVLFFSLVFSACGSTVEYGDASEDKGSAEWGPKEIKMTTSKMVDSIYTYLKDEWKQPAFLQVKKFQNKTSEHIDTKMISEEIVTQLIKKRISFIDDSLTADALDEMEKGMSGMIDPDSAVPMGYLKSPNMYLTGDVRDNVRTVKGKNVQYLVVTLKLYNLKTGVIMWQEQKEFLKTSKNTKISF